jgi:thioredoxin
MVKFRTLILLIVLLLPVAVSVAVYREKHPVEKQSHVAGPFHNVKVTPAMLDQALRGARAQHKVLMVEFGANWCSDCVALSQHFEQEETRDYLQQHFVLFKVDVGEFDRNLDMAKSLGVDISQGIPAAAFFAPDGNRIGATNSGELASSGKYGSNQILAFLEGLAERQRISNPQ